MTERQLRLVRPGGDTVRTERLPTGALPLAERNQGSERLHALRDLLKWAGSRSIVHHILPDRPDVVQVVRLLYDTDPQIRLNATIALGNAIARDRNGTVALLHLRYVLCNPSEALVTRYEASRALGTALTVASTREAAESIIRECLLAPDMHTRLLSQILLARFGKE